jgi:hypothetical protein
LLGNRGKKKGKKKQQLLDSGADWRKCISGWTVDCQIVLRIGQPDHCAVNQRTFIPGGWGEKNVSSNVDGNPAHLFFSLLLMRLLLLLLLLPVAAQWVKLLRGSFVSVKLEAAATLATFAAASAPDDIPGAAQWGNFNFTFHLQQRVSLAGRRKLNLHNVDYLKIDF